MFQAFQPRLRRRRGASTLLAASLAAAAMPLAAGAHAATDAGQVDGAAVYERQCAACHGGAVKKVPEKTMLQLMSARVILAAMEEGIMQPQASTLSRGEREAVAEYLSGQDLAAVPADVAPRCEAGAVEPGAVRVGAWGVNSGNQRYFPPSLAGMTAADLDDLELKWAVRFPDAIRARSQPAVAHGNVYLGSQSSGVVALDARRGCLRWQFPTVAEVRTGIVADPDPATPYLYFGDLVGYVYAIDARNGELLWRDRPDDHPSLTITAAPALHDGALYVSLSSLEVTAAADPGYECCSFRGAVVRYDAHSGERRWKSHTIPEAPAPAGRNAAGTTILAPSGAPVWNTPSIDPARGRLYVGTGENYSSPSEGHSDAIIAMDLADGAIAWVTQVTEGDAWNIACELEEDANCPAEDGPDYDFGAATIVARTGDGEDLVLAGQKSGKVYALDPDKGGAVRWERKLGRGGIQGGVHFGMAVAGDAFYVPMSDFYGGPRWPGEARPGMYRLDVATGETAWFHSHEDRCGERKHCQPGISAPASAIEGAVLAGAMDGVLRAYDADSGDLLWSFDTVRSFEALGGYEGRGGSFGGAAGPVFADGMLYVNSGYGIYEHMPGNVLLAFGPKAPVTAPKKNPVSGAGPGAAAP